jgi:hypothetical protein
MFSKPDSAGHVKTGQLISEGTSFGRHRNRVGREIHAPAFFSAFAPLR